MLGLVLDLLCWQGVGGWIVIVAVAAWFVLPLLTWPKIRDLRTGTGKVTKTWWQGTP
jgi:hypothetical protein